MGEEGQWDREKLKVESAFVNPIKGAAILTFTSVAFVVLRV